jgi:hypothetical protein
MVPAVGEITGGYGPALAYRYRMPGLMQCSEQHGSERLTMDAGAAGEEAGYSYGCKCGVAGLLNGR